MSYVWVVSLSREEEPGHGHSFDVDVLAAGGGRDDCVECAGDGTRADAVAVKDVLETMRMGSRRNCTVRKGRVKREVWRDGARSGHRTSVSLVGTNASTVLAHYTPSFSVFVVGAHIS